MNDPKVDSDLLSIEEAAQYLRLSVPTLARLRASNSRPYYVKLGRRVLYRKIELDAYIAANETNPNQGE